MAAAPRPQFELVDEPEPTKPAAGAGLLLLALKALSARFVVALADLFCLFTIGSVFALWYITPPDPSTNQIVSLSIYGVIVLAANWIVRTKR